MQQSMQMRHDVLERVLKNMWQTDHVATDLGSKWSVEIRIGQLAEGRGFLDLLDKVLLEERSTYIPVLNRRWREILGDHHIHKQSAEIRDYELALRDVERNLVIFQFVWNVLTCETCYVSQMFREIPKLCAECGKSERFREQKVKFWVCSGCKDTRYCSKECQLLHWKKLHEFFCKKK